MPKVHQHVEINITPERYLRACSPTELWELWMELNRPEWQRKLSEMEREQSFAEMRVPQITEAMKRLSKATSQIKLPKTPTNK